MRFTILVILLGCLCFAACDTQKATVSPEDDELKLPPDTVFVTHDVPPVLLEDVQAEYPRLAYEGGFTGYVVIKAFIAVDGAVWASRAVETNRPNMGFEEAAVKAAYKCRYKAATYLGNAVGVWIKYTYEFRADSTFFRGQLDSFNLDI